MSQITVKPSSPLKGTVEVPGDKSISHRAVIFGSIAKGTTQVENLLEGEDVLCTIQILRDLGVKIKKDKQGRWSIDGVGLRGLKAAEKILYCGNSGTTLRLMTGLLSSQPFESSLTGDVSLNKRPMGRVMEPLARMGASIEEVRDGDCRIIHIKGGPLQGGKFLLKVASAQLKTAIILAGLGGGVPVEVSEPSKSRDHTEVMLKAFGAPLSLKGLKISLKPLKKDISGQRIKVPGDFSSACFFIVAGLINQNPQTRILIKNVGINKTRIGALEVLKKMGGKILVKNKRQICGEPVADLLVAPSPLRGVSISGIIPRLIDEIPILCVAAALAKGKTTIHGAEELRIKETDRIHALATELPRFGISVKEFKDGLEIEGMRGKKENLLRGAVGKSYGDHRMAMSLAVLGTQAPGRTVVEDTSCIETSFPNFILLFRYLGAILS